MAVRMWSGAGRSADLISCDMETGDSLSCWRYGILLALRPVGEGHEFHIVGADVIGAGPGDLAVDAVLDDVRGPTGGAADDEQRREHRGGHPHEVIRNRREPVEIRKHVLDFVH